MAKPSQHRNQQMRLMLMFLGIIMLFLLFHTMVKPQAEIQEIKFHEFLEAVDLPAEDPKRIVEVTFKENEISGLRQDSTAFKAYGPNDPDLRKTLITKGVLVNFERPEEMSWWKTFLINSLPLVLLVLIFIFFMRQLQIGGGKAMSFGKSKAKLQSESDVKITFKDVAGIDEAKQELEEIIDFLKDPKKFTKLGGRIPKGVLLIGPPGTGKTILAKAIAGEAGVPFFSISGSDFVEMFVGVGASRVRDLFEQAKKHSPCIIFIDEIDAVGRHRGAGLGGGHDEREQTLNQLLVEMDGFESNEGVILIAATNRVDVLDPALLRPGRFDRRVVVPPPDVKGREGILKVHTRKTPMEDDVNLKTIAKGTPGFSGADLENLVNEAALLAARLGFDKVTNHHFELAKDKVMMGPERKSMVFGEKEKKTTAYHEAGHALVAHCIPGADPVHKLTIIPRGMALGVTMLLPAEDRLSLSKEQCEGTISYAMGGRAAEEVVFGHFTTGASDDIKKATDIARKMVCQWGMSEKLGPVHFGREHHDPFVGREMGQGAGQSEQTSRFIDEEVNRIINSAYQRAKDILTKNRNILEALAEALIIKETIEGRELDQLLRGQPIVSDSDREAYEKRKTESLDPDRAENRKDTEKKKDSLDASFAGGLGVLPQGT